MRLIVLFGCLLFPGMLIGAEQGGAVADGVALQAVLVELKQVRAALERAVAVAPRMQIVMQRLQFQQDAVLRASALLEQVKDQVESFRNSSPQEGFLAIQISQLESQISQEQNAAQRKSFEDGLRNLNSQLEKAREQQKLAQAQLSAREAELSSKLRLEEAKLAELNSRLDALERLLEPEARPAR